MYLPSTDTMKCRASFRIKLFTYMYHIIIHVHWYIHFSKIAGVNNTKIDGAFYRRGFGEYSNYYSLWNEFQYSYAYVMYL